MSKARLFLTRQLADRRVADAASSMYDIHRGFRDNTPDSYLDDVVRASARRRLPLAMYNMAYRNIFDDELNRATAFCACFTAHARSRAPTLARLRIGVLLRDHGTEQEQQEGVRAYLRPAGGRDHDWRAARASAEIALAYAHGRGARKNRFAAIEWAQHASRLQPDDEGIDEIQSQVLNSHSLVKTIGTVFGAYMGRGGISAEDLPPAGRAVGMARPAGPDGSCRPGCCWATRRWPARDWRWARRRCGCMRRCPARWAWPPGRWPCPCPSRAGRCCACPSRHAHPARKTACSRSRTRRRCSAIERVRAQVGAPALTRST